MKAFCLLVMVTLPCSFPFWACFISSPTSTAPGFAKLQMLGSLGLSEVAYGLGASLFFIGYLLFEQRDVAQVRRAALDGADHRQQSGQHGRGADLRLAARPRGVAGLQGWQWVFIVTGVPSILLTFAVLFLLPASALIIGRSGGIRPSVGGSPVPK